MYLILISNDEEIQKMLFKLNFYMESVGNCISVIKSESFDKQNEIVYLKVQDCVQFYNIKNSSEVLRKMEKMYGFLFVRDALTKKVYHMILNKEQCTLISEDKYSRKIFSGDKIVGEISFNQ